MGPGRSRRNDDALRIKNKGEEAQYSCCDHNGCSQDGIYRAPKSRSQLKEYHLFCLEHVRQYNKAWNYHEGLDEQEVEHSIRYSTTWERPSWPFGARREIFDGFVKGDIRDAFGFFGNTQKSHRESSDNAKLNYQELDAFDIMGLKPPIEIDELKSRYKYLVKLYHPDRHGGDKDAEERLKLVNEAYTTLKQFLL